MHISLPANLLGALVTYAYLRFIDPGAVSSGRAPGPGEILYFVVFFGGLVVVANWLGNRWSRPLRQRPVPPGTGRRRRPPPGGSGPLGDRRHPSRGVDAGRADLGCDVAA